MSPEHSTSASKHWRVWVGFFFFPFWLSLFGFLTSEASHEELEKSNVGGKKKATMAGTAWDKQGQSWLSCLPAQWVLAMPPSLENFSFPGQARSKCLLAGMRLPIHCSKPDTSAGSASRQHSPPASSWQRMPCYFEIKRLKKHERNGVEIVPGMFGMLSTHTKMSMKFFRRIFNFFLNKSCLKHSEIKGFLWKQKGAKQYL